MIDEIDLKIINILKNNSKIQYRDIGEIVYMTGQAVSNRIMRMEKEGIIKGYTAIINDEAIGINITAYITIFMKSTNHDKFKKILRETDVIVDADRISGEGCYILKAKFVSQSQLTSLLDEILEYGNYRVNISINKIK